MEPGSPHSVRLAARPVSRPRPCSDGHVRRRGSCPDGHGRARAPLSRRAALRGIFCGIAPARDFDARLSPHARQHMPLAEFETFARVLHGQYALEREIGQGGMGVVYLARDLKLDRPVAIKTLPPHLAGDPHIRERFLREARTAAALSHPNIVPIYRADEVDGP